MPHGKYFYIVSQLNGLALDIEGGDTSPGTNLITWEKKDEEPDNQLWYEEWATGTIRSKLNDLCITASGECLTMQEYEEGNGDQQWRVDSGRDVIYNREDSDKVFDILNNKDEEGAQVGAWQNNDGSNQKWNIHRVNTRCFLIKSQMNSLVVDIEGKSEDDGAKLIMWEETGGDNQLWYEDHDGIIRSKMHDFAISADNEDEAVMSPCESDNANHQWHRVGPYIARRENKGHVVLDIKQKNNDPGAELIAWNYTGGENQKWYYEYR